MRRHRPDPDQALFSWVWSDPADDRPDAPEDDDLPPMPPSLRARVRQRHADRVVELWGWPIRLARPSVAETTGTPSGNAHR